MVSEDIMFSPQEFYDYIKKNYKLDDVSSRLIFNILTYVKEQSFVDHEDFHRHLFDLLGGAFGVKEDEIRMCHFV